MPIIFKDIKNIDLSLLSINKKCMNNTDAATYEIKYIKVLMIRILIEKFLFVLVLMM